jgi:hypothetical protein
MPRDEPRQYRAGQPIEDRCRACKADRLHTVVVVDERGWPLRVACGFCGSEHNFRGGPAARREDAAAGRPAGAPRRGDAPEKSPFPSVADRELTGRPIEVEGDAMELERLLRRIIREEAGLSEVVPAEKWRGGTLVLRPGNATQEKSWPIETFFHKIVMLRNRLRTLEQHVNATDLPEDAKLKLQVYITGCYGSLTSFNVLFAEEDDHFRGSAAD